MIRVCYSNRSERLLDALIQNAQCCRDPSPFEAMHLVVPNRNVETFLKFGIARCSGIAANLRIHFLEDFVTRFVESSYPALHIARRAEIHGVLLALLHDEHFLRHPDLEPVRSYLHAADAALDRRRSQLAALLTHLFQEYTLSRLEMIAAWREGRLSCERPAQREVERWQSHLWREALGTGGRLSRRAAEKGLRAVTFDALFELVRPSDLRLPKHLHIYGISYFARTFQRALHLFSQATELWIYALNPCMEFWEDAPPLPFEDDPFALESPTETPALRLWARPGREAIRLLNALTECDFLSRFEDPMGDGPSLLHALQHDILHREPERTTPRPSAFRGGGDESLRIFACPGVRREVEVIAGEIWRLLREDESRPARSERLRLCDVAVIIPEAEQDAYRAHIASAFHECGDLPHNIVDLPLDAESRIAEAIRLLLDLPLGTFARPELLRVMTHPSVMGRFPDALAADWIAWCDALEIVHGADHQDHRPTYIERDLLNWDQGIRRLALGAFMAGRRSGASRPFAAHGERYLPEELPPGKQASAAAFALLARSLIADARFARSARMPLAGWLTFLHRLFTAYLLPETEEEERALSRCRRQIQSLAELQLDDLEVSYSIVHELARSALGTRAGSRGQHLADGVVVSSFLPMRAIPFRAAFVAGLGEKQFPARDRQGPLDLRTAQRRQGDVTPRERDRYMFLEVLLCARDRLTLSYVARDELTGDALAPSPVVSELAQMLERGYVGPELARERIYRSAPLRRSADEQACEVLPAAHGEAAALALAADLRRFTGHAGAPDWPVLRRELPEAEWRFLRDHLGLCPAPRPPPGASPAPLVSLSTRTLRQFLENPMQGYARFVLGMREDEEDATTREDESFATARPQRIALLREIFLRRARTCGALEETYDRTADLLELAGALPTGLFARAERERHLEILRRWEEIIARIGATGTPALLRFGRAEEHAEIAELYEPIFLEESGLKLEIHGHTEPLFETPRGSLILAYRSESHASDWRECLRAFLDHALLAAAGQPSPEGYQAFLCNGHPDAAGGQRVRFAPLSREEARSYLLELARDLLSSPHPYLLPCEAVYRWTRNRAQRITDIVDDFREDPFQLFSGQNGPIRNPARFDPPGEEEARAMVERRFGLFLRTLQEKERL
jgi:exodeoxyribonuclease V gamma subunit